MHDETPDQKRLRAITDEVDAILKKHDVGGIALIVTKESAAWAHNLPTWVDVVETPHGVQIKFRAPFQANRVEQTMHALGCLRDMASDCVNIYGRLFRLGRHQLKEIGDPRFEKKVVGGSDRILRPLSKTN